MRHGLIPAAMLAAGLVSNASPSFAEWDNAACVAGVEAARVRAQALPPGHLSRRFAENDLATALMEMEAGDVDECEELVRRADETVVTLRYMLKPGQALDGYGPDQAR